MQLLQNRYTGTLKICSSSCGFEQDKQTASSLELSAGLSFSSLKRGLNILYRAVRESKKGLDGGIA